MLASLDRALAARDADEFRRAAHSLKSNSNTFGALDAGRAGPRAGAVGHRSGARGQCESRWKRCDANTRASPTALTELRHA